MPCQNCFRTGNRPHHRPGHLHLPHASSRFTSAATLLANQARWLGFVCQHCQHSVTGAASTHMPNDTPPGHATTCPDYYHQVTLHPCNHTCTLQTTNRAAPNAATAAAIGPASSQACVLQNASKRPNRTRTSAQPHANPSPGAAATGTSIKTPQQLSLNATARATGMPSSPVCPFRSQSRHPTWLGVAPPSLPSPSLAVIPA